MFKPKQETLEEANWKVIGTKDDTFFNGANWQSERMYSEEEVKQMCVDAINSCTNGANSHCQDFDEWFEQFKKK